MAINNLNPRRIVWFSPNEPSNKYDIWLSKNAHYDENGEPVTDSTSQRGCDYIFKIYDCGKWNPIVGFNTTALNKMNIVKDSPAYTGLEGDSHSGFTEFHLPLFRDPDCSPDELFDAGTVGTVIKEYVTSEEWYYIIHEGGLGLQIELYYNDNPFDLPPAGSDLGGILMNRFSASDLTPVISTNISVLSLAKYSTVSNDYHPYVNVKDIISIINTGIAGEISFDVIGSGGSGSSIDQLLLYNSFRHSRSIKRDWDENPPQTDALKPHFSIWGANNVQNAGKLLRLRPNYELWEQHNTSPYSESNNALDWVDPLELFNEYLYELPLASLGALGGIRAGVHSNPGLSYNYLAECKLNQLQPEVGHEYSAEALFVDVRDVKLALDNWYADNDSTVWDLNIGSGYGINTIKFLIYNPFTGVTTNRYTHILDHYTNDTSQGLFCRTKYYENGNAFGNHYGLEWVSAQTIVEEGLGISGGEGYLYYDEGAFSLMPAPGGGGGDPYPVLGSSNYTEDGNYVIGVPSGGTGGPTRYLNGLGRWSVPTINVPTFNGSSPGLVPQSTLLTRDKYLKGDGTWDVPSVNADFDIDINSRAITSDSNFILNNLHLSSSALDVSLDLLEWNYYTINCSAKTSQFTFLHTHNSGNAIYIRINVGLRNVAINTNSDIIFSNLTINSSLRLLVAENSYLITIQFGIIKIEKITTSVLQENS